MRHRRLTKLMGAIGLVAALASVPVVTSFAKVASPSTPVQVSSADPFANCTIGSIGEDGQPGTVYPDAEVEPRVAVNPHNPSNIIGVWQQDRWSNGGSRGLVAGYTTDGGKHWNESWPAFSECAGGTAANGGDFERTSDPWITFAPDRIGL